MTARTLDVSQLPPFEISSSTPLWWGQVAMAAVEGMMFCILIAMYFYIRLSVDAWPPPGVDMPNQLLPAGCVLLMLLSSIGSYLASEAAKKNDSSGMLIGMGLNLVLALGAMTLRGMQWSTFHFTWKTNAYGSVVWGIFFLHSLDVIADLIFTAVLFVAVAAGRHGPRTRLGVHVDSVIWYFLAAIWIPLYVTVQWGPWIVGTP